MKCLSFMIWRETQTYHWKGEKEINIIIHLGSKHRVTIGPAISSDGDVLPILLVFLYTNAKKNARNGKKNLRNCPKKMDFTKNITKPYFVRFNSTGFNNISILNEWFLKIIVPYAMKKKWEKNKKIALLIDYAKFHSVHHS